MFSKLWPVAIPVVIGCLGYGYARWEGGAPPSVKVEATTDLGVQDNNKLVVARIIIRNAGRRELMLSGFRISCPSCLTVEIPADPDDRVTLASGEALNLDGNIMVHGGPDKPFAVGLFCETNDPARPELDVVFKAQVRGRLVTTPQEFDFGRLKGGEVLVRRIDVRDTGRGRPFHLGRIEVPSNARVISPDPPPPPAAAGEGAGEIVGTVYVEFTAPSSTAVEPMSIRSSVLIYEAGDDTPSVRVPVRGDVPARVIVSPAAALVLPQTVGGALVYSVECSLAAEGGADVSLADCPPELSVTRVAASADRFRVEWKAESRPPAGQGRAATVQFRVGADQVGVLIRCLTPGGP